MLYFMGNSMFWGIGYAVMWGSKWVLNSIFTNENIFENVRGEMEIRLSNIGEAQETFTAGMVLRRNWDVINQFPFQLVIAGCILIANKGILKESTSYECYTYIESGQADDYKAQL